MNEGGLIEAILALFQAENEAEALQVLRDHPEILGDEADALLGQLISIAGQRGTLSSERSSARCAGS